MGQQLDGSAKLEQILDLGEDLEERPVEIVNGKKRPPMDSKVGVVSVNKDSASTGGDHAINVDQSLSTEPTEQV
ncbi:hypothetical protein GOBAR_DD04664 [Gossypium barbadense]|nr:hypothetical protein GOBAR_DD04664 [Gossypium barbadense]